MNPFEKKVQDELLSKKRSFFNPEDPFYKHTIHSTRNMKRYETKEMLEIISPEDHSVLMKCSSPAKVKANSKALFVKFCD